MGFIGPINCPPGSVVVTVVMATKKRKVFFFFLVSLGISLRIYYVVAVLGVLWPRGVA